MPFYGGRKFGPYPNAEHFAGLLTMMLPLALFLTEVEGRKELKILYQFFAIVIFASLIFTTSRASIMGF
ncbi:MAG: hypothetical protein ACXQTX_00280, partial [Candidatus Syntropharchaeia archaeon]